MGKIRTSITIDRDLKGHIKRVALIEGRSLSNMIEWILGDYKRNRDEKVREDSS